MRLLLLAAVLIASPALAQLQVENAWARATPPGAKIGAGYMTIRNTSRAPDKLVSASSPAAQRVELHATVREGDVARMRPVTGYEIRAGGRVELAPGGSHLMLVNLKAPLKEGQKVPLALRFEKGGDLKVEMEIRSVGASAHDHHKGH